MGAAGIEPTTSTTSTLYFWLFLIFFDLYIKLILLYMSIFIKYLLKLIFCSQSNFLLFLCSTWVTFKKQCFYKLLSKQKLVKIWRFSILSYRVYTHFYCTCNRHIFYFYLFDSTAFFEKLNYFMYWSFLSLMNKNFVIRLVQVR